MVAKKSTIAKKLATRYPQRKVPGTKKRADRARPAKSIGWRVSEKTGRLYYEDRENRSDTEKERKYFQGAGRRATPGKKTGKQSTRTTRSTTTARRVSQIGKQDKQKGHRMMQCKPRKPVVKTRKGLNLNRGRRGNLVKVLRGHWFTNTKEIMLMESESEEFKGQYFLWYRRLPAYKEKIYNYVPDWELVIPESLGSNLSKAESTAEEEMAKLIVNKNDGLFDMTVGLHNLIEEKYSGSPYARPSRKDLDRMNPQIKKYERKIHNLKDHEEAMCFDYKCRLLWHEIGHAHNVGKEIPIYVYIMTEVFTHNHPSSRYSAPSPLSDGDIESYIKFDRPSYKCRELRACGHGYVCRMNYTITKNQAYEIQMSIQRIMNKCPIPSRKEKEWYSWVLPRMAEMYLQFENSSKWYSEEKL